MEKVGKMRRDSGLKCLGVQLELFMAFRFGIRFGFFAFAYIQYHYFCIITSVFPNYCTYILVKKEAVVRLEPRSNNTKSNLEIQILV